jgi:histidinol phosphatase-like PHP family hydrolase
LKVALKIVLALLAVLIAVQVPFVYRRHQIGQLGNRIDHRVKGSFDRQTFAGYTEYKGVMHVHTFLGGHSTGTFEELITAANANNLDFVVMTEHYESNYDTSALTLNGGHGRTLFINGQEVDTNDGGRFLLLPGSAESPSFNQLDSKTFLDKIHSEGRIAINNYPDRNRSGVAGFDGIEAYSLHINLKQANIFTAIGDVLWSFGSYPEATIATYLRPNRQYLETYDRIAAEQRLLLAAGADAHSNKGYYLAADDEGNKHFGIKLDPYETAFRVVRMHVLLESGTPLTRESVIDALRRGHAFVGFDVLGDTSGFRYWAAPLPTGNVQPPAAAGGTDIGSSDGHIMGDEIALGSGVKLSAFTPGPSRIVFLKNGAKFAEFSDVTEISLNVTESGTYRVEAYLDQLGEPFDQAPWIMSNPIYVR